MKIDRSVVLSELEDFARAGSGVVIGPPGVGKSYLLRQLNERLDADKTPHVFIPVDQLGTGTQDELASWFGSNPTVFFRELLLQAGEASGIVVFDAFDAARSEESRARILNLVRSTIGQVGNDWSVVVAVRTYDATRSKALMQLFADQDGEFGGLRVYRVPVLTDGEIAQAVSQIRGLSEVIANAGREFLALLHTPFNLWLAEQMLERVSQVEDLSLIRSEAQLLEAFWRRRVTLTKDSEERESVLASVVTEMIRRRTVSVPRPSVYKAGAQIPWTALLSNEVLRVDEQRQGGPPNVSFSHNILFDYAVSVLAIGDAPSDLVDFVSQDSSRPLFLQPSLAYYLARAWYYRPESFWQLSKAIQRSDSLPVKVFARLVPPLTVAREARTRAEMQPLFDACRTEKEFAHEFVLRLFQALHIEPKARAGLWTSVAAELSDRLDRRFAWDLITYTQSVLESPGGSHANVIASVGKVARNACMWVLNERGELENQWLSALGANWVVPLVIRTSGTNPEESTRLLTAVLAIADEPEFPLQYLYQLSNEVERVASLSPSLAAAIYRRVYGKDEESITETQFGTPVLPLRSTRRQDYGMCRYVLAKSYPVFLKQSFAIAAQAGIEAINSHVIRNRIRSGKPRVLKFDYRGRKARYRPDYSYIWGDGRYHEDAIELSDDLFAYVGDRASSGDAGTVETFLDLLATYADVAFLWRSLLVLAAKKPTDVIPYLRELLLADPILTEGETVCEAGEVLRKAGDALSGADWALVEARIASLPGKLRGKRRDWVKHARNRLLVSFPNDRLTNLKLREERQVLLDDGVRNEALSRMTVSSKEFTHRDWLEEEGVVIKAPENEPLLDLRDELERQTTAWTNKKIPVEVAKNFLDVARNGIKGIRANPSAAALVQDGIWTEVGKSLSFAALRAVDLTVEERQELREMLLMALGDDVQAPETDSAFEFPSWSPTRVTESSRGVVYLAAASDFDDVFEALRHLSIRGSNAVRFLVTSELPRLHRQHESLFWEIVDERLQNESKRAIRDALFKALYSIPSRESPNIAARAVAQFERERLDSEAGKEASSYGLLLTWLALRRREPDAIKVLDRLIVEAGVSPKLTRSVMRAAVETIAPPVLADPDRAFIAHAAGDFISRGIQEVRRAFVELAAKKEGRSDEDLQELYGILDDTTHLLRANLRRSDDRERPDLDSIATYYEIVKPILVEVVRFGHHDAGGVIYAPTAHRLMEFFNVLLPVDPAGILHLATEVAVASERTGYNLDGMAIREVVTMVEELLADYRLELQEPAATADLVRLLDVFARAGWPDAMRLVLRLDEVFR